MSRRDYRDLSRGVREWVYHSWWDHLIYFCPECNEADRDDFTDCPRYPREHDGTGYVGTGTDFPADLRELAWMIAEDQG